MIVVTEFVSRPFFKSQAKCSRDQGVSAMDKQAKKPKVRPKSLIKEITKDHVEDIKSIVSTFAPRVCVTREEDEDLIGCYAIFKANSANDKLDKTLKECWSAIAFLYSTLQIYNFAARETLDFAKVVTIAEE